MISIRTELKIMAYFTILKPADSTKTYLFVSELLLKMLNESATLYKNAGDKWTLALLLGIISIMICLGGYMIRAE